MQGIMGNESAAGFAIEEGSSSNIILTNCTAQDISIPASAISPAQTAGFIIFDSTCFNIQFINCNALNIAAGANAIVSGFEQFGSNIMFDNCFAQNCSAFLGFGFSITGTNIMLTNCKANNCNSTTTMPSDIGAGFSVTSQSVDVSIQDCQSSYNIGNGFSLFTASATITNSLALGNQYIGFTTTGTAVYHCFASQNNTNYSGPVNLNNASDQATTSTASGIKSGPIAGGNIFL